MDVAAGSMSPPLIPYLDIDEEGNYGLFLALVSSKMCKTCKSVLLVSPFLGKKTRNSATAPHLSNIFTCLKNGATRLSISCLIYFVHLDYAVLVAKIL